MLYLPTIMSILEVLAVTVPVLLTVALITIAERKTMASNKNRINSEILIDKVNTIPKPHEFANLPLHSGMFSINRIFLIGLASSILTAGIGFLIRLVILYSLKYDI